MVNDHEVARKLHFPETALTQWQVALRRVEKRTSWEYIHFMVENENKSKSQHHYRIQGK